MSSPTSHDQYQQQYGSYYSTNSEYPAFYVNYPSSYEINSSSRFYSPTSSPIVDEKIYISSNSYTPNAAYEFYGNNKISTVPVTSTSCSPQSSSSSFNFGTNINNLLIIYKRYKIGFRLELFYISLIL